MIFGDGIFGRASFANIEIDQDFFLWSELCPSESPWQTRVEVESAWGLISKQPTSWNNIPRDEAGNRMIKRCK
jgi:hypothetical protein